MTTRKPADPSARLALLRPVLAALAPDTLLNADDMAKAAGMTWRNMKLTIDRDADFPIRFRGGEGVAWQFDALAVIRHLIASCESKIADGRAKMTRLALLTGIAAEPPESGEAPAMSANELKQATDAMLAVHKLKLARGEYLQKAEAMAFFVDLMSSFQADVLHMVGKIDPAGQWPAEQRKAVEDQMRTLLVGVQDRVNRFTDRHRVPAAS